MTKHGTGIEWTHIPGFKGETWNPIVGCSVVSPGCTNCYAMTMAARLEAMGVSRYSGLTSASSAGPVWTGEVRLAPPETLAKPLKLRAPRAFFVNSMGDLFHEDIPEDWIFKVFAVMALCPQHVFIVLTKRPERMWKFLSDRHDGKLLGEYSRPGTYLHEISDAGFKLQRLHFPKRSPEEKGRALDVSWPLQNVWLGVSVEDQKRAHERIPPLMHTPAAKRILSCEPLLGPIDLRSIDVNGDGEIDALFAEPWSFVIEQWRDTDPDWKESFEDWYGRHPDAVDPAAPMYRSIDWVIAGGESGSGARPLHPEWVKSIRNQCSETGVPFFFKQWGAWMPVCEMSEDLMESLYPDPPKTDPLRTMPSKCEHRVIDTAGNVRAIQDGMAFTGPNPMGIFKVGKSKAGNSLQGISHLNWPEKIP